MLALDRIGKVYPNGVNALERFSAEIQLGEIIAIGPEGMGVEIALEPASGDGRGWGNGSWSGGVGGWFGVGIRSCCGARRWIAGCEHEDEQKEWAMGHVEVYRCGVGGLIGAGDLWAATWRIRGSSIDCEPQ